MAFTISHMVVAPVLYRVFFRKIPLASIALGAMTPDLPRLFGFRADFAHTMTGVFSIDLLIGLVGCLLWFCFYRPVCYHLFNKQLPSLNSKSYFDLIFYCIIGVLIGGLTHLVWDGLTHDDFRTFIGHTLLAQVITLPWLGIEMPIHRILQYLTSFIALPFLYYLVKPILQAQPLPISCQTPSWLPILLIAVCGLVGTLTSIYYLPSLSYFWQHDTYGFIGRLFVIFSQGFLLCFSLFAIILRIAFARRLKSCL
ncbi:DUF4184 family protein [Acinetobacter populi]|uniref:Phospholipase n=1 Tax=Acinetobacter populi TaxID=1582270 RepID=A0A1Z9YTQ4_9GAMM|nr:DUF4184 family protein [Acinetobacter populi]OUY05604.1 hypothetical protein CAP51_16810 [Acinetobacter populi]